jgi:hypothetical protein
MSYMRVIPRDLFNEANLLKCYGQLVLQLELGTHRATLSDESMGDAEAFDIQADIDGRTTVANLPLVIGDVEWQLWRPLNSRELWPLYAESADGESVPVFTDGGNLSVEFQALIQ